MNRAKKTQSIAEALFGSVSENMPDHLRHRCLREFEQGRNRTLSEQAQMEHTVKAMPTGPMPERDTPEWDAWWQRYYARPDVMQAMERIRGESDGNDTTAICCPFCESIWVKMTGVAASENRTHAEIDYLCQNGHAWQAVFRTNRDGSFMYIRLPKTEAMEDAA